MTANMFLQRVQDNAARNRSLTVRLLEAAAAAGFDDDFAVCNALNWTAIQLDPEDDDYETWEATLLARLNDADQTGER
jgi:hypothetical protein